MKRRGDGAGASAGGGAEVHCALVCASDAVRHSGESTAPQRCSHFPSLHSLASIGGARTPQMSVLRPSDGRPFPCSCCCGTPPVSGATVRWSKGCRGGPASSQGCSHRRAGRSAPSPLPSWTPRA